MPSAYLRPGEFVEVISYDVFITGIGLSIASGIVRLVSNSSQSSQTWVGLAVSSGILVSLSLFLWRLSSSIEDRVSKIENQPNEA